MPVIAGPREDQDHQEAIVRIVTREVIEMRVEDIDLQEEIETIIEEETEEVRMTEMQREAEEVQMTEMLREAEEGIEVIQGIEEEIIIESVLDMKEKEVMMMIEEEVEDKITLEIKASRKEADPDLTVKPEKIDMKKHPREVTEEIGEKGQIIMIKIRDLKMIEMDKNNIILPERKVKVPKTFPNKMTIKLTMIQNIIIKLVTKRKTA
jgi:hypothetical protein